MEYPQKSCLNPATAIFAGTLREVLDILCGKHPDEVLALCTRKDARVAISPVDLERLVMQYSGDAEIREIISRRFSECRLIGDTIPGSTSRPTGQRYDLLSELDEGSACILRILYEQGYATLDELSDCSGFSHNDVLYRLKEIIVPVSVKRRGRPVVVFRESGTDLCTGRQVAFSWWLNDDPCHSKDAVEVVETDEFLIITLDRSGNDLPVNLHSSATCKHGILEIRVDTRHREGIS
ncbi:MAG: hypothetical protein WC586_06130 [Methanoregula sp.]